MGQQFVEEGNPPSGTCWPCRKCKPDDGFKCFFRGHLGCCEELNYAGHKCGMLFTMERGCMYHPYGLGYNKDIKPTRDPFKPRGEVFRMPGYTHDQKALGIDPKAPRSQNFFERTDFAKKMRKLQLERSEKEKAVANESANSSPTAAVVKDASEQSAIKAPVTNSPTAAEPTKTESSPLPSTEERSLNGSSERSSSKRRPSTSTRSRKESYSTLACGAETNSIPLASNMVRGH